MTPAVKKVTIKSSMLSVKANNAPEIIAGARLGKTTNRKVCQRLAPRSRLASSILLSKYTVHFSEDVGQDFGTTHIAGYSK